MLSVLGLDELQERAYRALLQMPSGSPDEVARRLGVEPARVVVALEALQSLGLTVRSAVNPGLFTASPPELALGSLIVDRQQDIRRAELELRALSELFRDAAAERVHTDVIDVVRGGPAVAQHFAQLQRGARREVCALVRPDVAVVSADENLDERRALERGVSYRVVVEARAFEQPGFARDVQDSLDAGERIRVTEEVPTRLLLSDRRLALVPLMSDDGSIGALLLHPSGLLDALCSLFDMVWRGAHPVRPDEAGELVHVPEELEELDAHLLTLLQAGLTDEVIAAQLSTSLRTVQRRLRHLMGQAGVRTRFQLGVVAARRAWLPESAESTL